jgi:predicted flap endonuclease-1-like 5' DNA nuclease
MAYKIEEIEGIGPKKTESLVSADIKTTEDLLSKCGTVRGREVLAKVTGLTEKELLKFVNMADLMRINGVGEEYSELLEAAGVDTVKELKMRRPDNLTAKLAEVNQTKKLVRSLPSESVVAGWVEQAKTMQPMVSH